MQILLLAAYIFMKLGNTIYVYHSKYYSNFYNSAPIKYWPVLVAAGEQNPHFVKPQI